MSTFEIEVGESQGKNDMLTEAEVNRAAFLLNELMGMMRPQGNQISYDAHAVASLLIGIERTEREACAKIVDSKWQEARDTEFDLGFETARKCFAAAIRSRGETKE